VKILRVIMFPFVLLAYMGFTFGYFFLYLAMKWLDEVIFDDEGNSRRFIVG
jgi:hypothetical protein